MMKKIYIVTLIICLTSLFIGCSEENNETYRSELLGLEISFPQEWTGKYLLEEDETGITVYHAETHQKYPMMGILFLVRKFQGGADVYNKETNPGGNYVISQTDDYTYLLIVPTDVQFDPNNSKEYIDMSEQIGKIREGIKFTQ